MAVHEPLTATAASPLPTPAGAEVAAGRAVSTGAGPASLRLGAITLWTVVSALLGYGVLQTGIKASALFTG